jgi:putative RNA 2'-phosphotransferase
MALKKSPRDLAKLLAYILGRRPDEFALVPEADGYIRVKSLLQALSEEAGWRHVRESHLREILLSVPDPPVEMVENRIRAVDRSHLLQPEFEPAPPGILYGCVRRRAWPHVKDKGLAPSAEAQVCLAADEQAALRRGRRIDPDPVTVNIHTSTACRLGAVFFRYGPRLFLTDAVPAAALTGPPLPKVKEAVPVKPPAPAAKTPGSFVLDLTQDRASAKEGRKRKKDPHWKRERRRSRKR